MGEDRIEMLERVMDLLDEARGFAAMSPGGRDNITEVYEMLPDLMEKTYRSGFVDGETHNAEGPEVQILRGALKMIIKEDDTGEMEFELRENGPSQAVGRGKGKFAKIALLAIASASQPSGIYHS